MFMIIGSYAHGQIQVEVHRVYDWTDVMMYYDSKTSVSPIGMPSYDTPDSFKFKDSLSVDGMHGYYLSLYEPMPRKGEPAYYAARVAAIQACKDNDLLFTDYNEYYLRDKAGDMDHELRMMIQNEEQMNVIRDQYKLMLEIQSKSTVK